MRGKLNGLIRNLISKSIAAWDEWPLVSCETQTIVHWMGPMMFYFWR